MTTITQVCKPIPEERRAAYARKVFGSGYPLLVEPVIFAMADMLSPDYKGGMWLYCGICPEGTMYSYPDTDDTFRVVSPNGFGCTMSSSTTPLCFSCSRLSVFKDGREVGAATVRYFDVSRSETLLAGIDCAKTFTTAPVSAWLRTFRPHHSLDRPRRTDEPPRRRQPRERNPQI